MNRFARNRNRLVTITVIFLAIGPTLGVLHAHDPSTTAVWFGLLAGALALALAWLIWGNRFLDHTNTLLDATRRLAAGDFSVRTNATHGELGELAQAIDSMAGSLRVQVGEREAAERTLLNRTHQQTVIAALGQFALASNQLEELFNQAVNFIVQTLELEYCGVWELHKDQHLLHFRAGAGWKSGAQDAAHLSSDPGSLVHTLFTAAGALAIADLRTETRFRPPEFFTDHGFVSGVCVTIHNQPFAFGTLCVGTTRERKFSEDEIHFLLAVATIISMAVNRRQAESDLQKAASFAQLNPNPVLEFTADGTLEYFNEAAMDLANGLGHEHPREMLPPEIRGIVAESLRTQRVHRRHLTRHGTRTVSWSFFPIPQNETVHCYAGEITEVLNLEAQLRQSQKMESVGQLAAGVAHDFNNMLTIIQGHSGVIMARPHLPPEMLDSAQAIYFASERAANLTRQLLMFSRKNIIQRKTLDLRNVVNDMTKMLQRMIGEIITLRFTPPPECPGISGDSGMIEQVIMNLGVNARDAMSKGGTLTLALQPVTIRIEDAATHPQSRPGQFLRLEVSDTGHGMTPETQARIFEPFFTTKEIGKGTGLGLATVYGIVKQHDGWVEVQSEIGKGTVFHVYFPVVETKVEKKTETQKPGAKILGGNETILIVEDEPVLRDLADLILKEQGYHTLLAGTGVEAVRIWEQECAHIDLLLTDMVMPEGMSGRDLAARLRQTRRDLKVICVSGYSVDDIKGDSIVFLQKPYTRQALAKTVRDTLDGKS